MLDRKYERSQVSPPRLVHGPRAVITSVRLESQADDESF